MDVTDEQEKSSKSTPVSSEQHACFSSKDHVIPQMVITSADDASEEKKNVTECTLVLIPPSNGHSTDKNNEVFSEHVKPVNDVTGEKHKTDFEDISVVVRDVITRCTDSVSHSVSHRPLVVEVEKNLQQQEISKEESSVRCPPPPPPVPSIATPLPIVSPTTTQRPLVFEGVTSKTDVVPTVEIENKVCATVESTEIQDKQNVDVVKSEVLSNREISSENAKFTEETTPSKKDGLHGVKKFFDSLWNPEIEESPVDSNEIVPQKESDAHKSEKSDKIFHPCKDSDVHELPQLSKSNQLETKESASFAKDAKHSIKAFFDTFKHEPSEYSSKDSSQTKDKLILSNVGIESHHDKTVQFSTSDNSKRIKESSSFVKDTKQNIKAFFDTFKQEPSEYADKDCENVDKNSSELKSIESGSDKIIQSSALENQKEIKESAFLAKDVKQNIKTFFDTFRHEPNEQKHKSDTCKISLSQSDVGKQTERENIHSPPSENLKEGKEASFAKETKENIRAFFETFKHEPADQNQKSAYKKSASQPDFHLESEKSVMVSGPSPEISKDKELTSFAKDTKQNIKSFFDSFKHESSTSKQKDAVKLPVDAQVSTKIHDQDSRTLKLIEENKEPTTSDLHKEATDLPKDIKHPLKKFFSFKHASEGIEINTPELVDTSSTHLENKSVKEKLVKGTKSVKLDLDPKYSSNDIENIEKIPGIFSHTDGHEPVIEIKERAQSVPSDSSRSKHFSFPFHEFKKTEVTNSDVIDSSVSKTESQKESLHGIKKFFESFKHEKSDMEKTITGSLDSKNEMNEQNIAVSDAEINRVHTIEKPAKEKKSIKRSLSDKLSREEVVQNFKGFFDSISHRSSSKKCLKEGEHIYDVVEVKPMTSNSAPDVQISFEEADVLVKLAAAKGETEADAKTTGDNVTSSEIIEPSSSKHDRSSMFNSIGENLLALKEKMLHSKEKRKSELVDDSTKVSDVSSRSVEVGKDSEPKSSVVVVNDKKSREVISKVKPIPPTKPAHIKESAVVQPSQSVNSTDISANKYNTSPTSLYDTCCMKIAILLHDKALDIVTEHTKSPPPKPPKPSAEAIARARAAAVSKRLAEIKVKSHSIGENIPVGCDGMRFVDDETESSCDYKDVENLDYIMDYELINRYKLDSNKLDTFSVPSTCSGLTSYYTADTITLRDETFSDAVLETVSLGSDISSNFKYLSTSSKSEQKISSVTNLEESKQNNTDILLSPKELSVKQTTVKKIPPPIPPKPVILQNISKLKKSDDKSLSPCVNGLSLSPRLQNKFPKDPAATQKRPLMVAGIKGTQFSSLQHPKPKVSPAKPIRNFDTVLKNETLKNVSEAPLSSQDSADVIKTEDLGLSNVKIEKRTKSPPRPPPPNIARKPAPQRPPLPVRSLKSLPSEIKNEEKPENMLAESENSKNESSHVDQINDKEINKLQSSFDEKTMKITVKKPNEYVSTSSDMPLPDDISNRDISEIFSTDKQLPQYENMCHDSSESDLNKNKDEINNNIELTNDIVDSLNNNTELSKDVETKNPKPPPRNRRIRSRTVEVFPIERYEERMKRSQSLTEIDLQKRVTFLNGEKSNVDSKSLYTVVNKNGKKLINEKTAQSSPDLVSYRPLPAPPPPPRKFRSLERKSRSKRDDDNKRSEKNLCDDTITLPGCNTGYEIKAPTRRKRTDKQRFFSLHSEHKKETDFTVESLKRASSVPSKPDRKVKIPIVEKYDVNANISNLSDIFEKNLNSSNPDIPKVDNTDSLSKNKSVRKKEPDTERKSHSSWYDEDGTLSESWEIVDAIPHELEEESKQTPVVPLRRRLDSKRKSRETSKFYVAMEQEQSAHPPLVDKETSPLPLDCSEKSVQTSLETLSQGIVSHDDDEQSEDTDELLDLAQTLQKELSNIINRHKSINESAEETPSPPLSAVPSDKNVAEDFKEMKKASSVRSSTSEVWPLTSSDESDVERGDESSNLNEVAVKKKQKKIFYIAQEIMTSEEAFVDSLKLLNVDFKVVVEFANKQKNMSVIPEDALCQILNHLPQLLHLNENLLMELKDRIENWDKHEKIADIIVKMGPFLKLYSWYIHDFESNISLLEECKKKYPAFAQVVKEFEMSARCKRLTLNHYMLKPIQRIPQYRLLLQEYLHHLTEDSKDYQDTVTALQIVSEVANHANDSMKHGDNAQKLISIQNSIMGHKEIVKPGRIFVKEGELMKLSRKGMQPRWFVLFNDLLLYLTPVQQGLYRVNHELLLTGMKVAIPIQQDYQNEFSIISVTRSFTLAARSPEERQEWIIALTKAIEENASKRSTFTNSRLQKMQDKTSSEDEGAFVLGRKAPVWIPDARVTMCQLCTSEFTVTFRRHHCRACGKVVCSICSSHRISLPYLGNRIARVCDECHAHLGQGSSACTESGETDSDNQQIALKSHLRTDSRHLKKNKRMLPSVLKEVCANDQGSTISGYLHKKTGKSWKRDWFVVKDKVLYEYKASEDVAALRSIPLLGYAIELFSEAYEGVDASLLFQLTHPGQAPIVFYADTVGSTERWVSALKTATVLE